jgi:hypothetical protein
MESLNVIDVDSQQKYMKRFLLGILIYSISINLFVSGWISAKIVNIIQLTGLALFSFYWIKLASWQNISSWYLRITLSLLLIWEIYIVCHGFIFNYQYLKEHLFTDNRSLPYLLPLALFVTVNNSFFLKKVFDYCYKLGIIFLIALPVCLPFLLDKQYFSEQYVWVFAMGCGFILLTSFYQPRKRLIVALIVIVLALLLITIMARRNIMLTCACFLLFSFFIIPVINKNTSLIKKVLFILSFTFTVLVGYSVFISNQHGIFYKITKRATDNTREVVFFYYLMDMSDTDFLLGKGLNGTYFCPGVDKEWTGGEDLKYRDLDYRVYIECGYLQLLLNGGIIYLAIYLLILIPAIIKGLFFSRNLFSKSCAILILMHLIDMFPFGLPSFSLRGFLVWFCIAICYSKEMRLKNEEEMQSFLSFKELTV